MRRFGVTCAVSALARLKSRLLVAAMGEPGSSIPRPGPTLAADSTEVALTAPKPCVL